MSLLAGLRQAEKQALAAYGGVLSLTQNKAPRYFVFCVRHFIIPGEGLGVVEKQRYTS